jgi:hypothetical protein
LGKSWISIGILPSKETTTWVICLAGLDPYLEDFAILPLHFTVGNPIDLVGSCEAVKLMYGPLLQQWAVTKDLDQAALLWKVLPSLV